MPEGAQVPEWANDMPEEVKTWEEVTNSDTPEKFWDQMTNHRKFLGQSVRIPGEDASDEDKGAFHQKLMDKVPGLIKRPDMETDEGAQAMYTILGRPEKSDDYKIPEIESEVELDKSSLESFKPIAHKWGLSQKQFEGISADLANEGVAATIARQDAAELNMGGLKTEWGSAFPARMQRVQKVAELTKAPTELLEVIKAGALSAESAKWLYDLSLKFKGEDNNLINDETNSNVMSPDEAKIKISEIRNNKDHPYWKKSDPGHKAAKAQMSKLYQIATPTTT